MVGDHLVGRHRRGRAAGGLLLVAPDGCPYLPYQGGRVGHGLLDLLRRLANMSEQSLRPCGEVLRGCGQSVGRGHHALLVDQPLACVTVQCLAGDADGVEQAAGRIRGVGADRTVPRQCYREVRLPQPVHECGAQRLRVRMCRNSREFVLSLFLYTLLGKSYQE
jgi:hypothetical protein